MSNQPAHPIFEILLLYEDVLNPNSDVDMDDYIAYLDRISVEYLGKGRNDIYHYIVGLKALGNDSTHRIVKSVVFHMMNMINKGGDSRGV